MNTSPLISIIIPAYNTVDVIEQTLKSIEAQTYQNYEIIIVDDGSTDGTGKLIDHYQQDHYNCLVFHQSNSGVSHARNKGIELSTGELICFLDSDDTYSPLFLEKMLLRQQEIGANIVYCGLYRVKNNSFVKEKMEFNEGNIVNFFIKKSFHISGMLFKRSFLIDNQITFDSTITICEDILFTLTALSYSDAFAVEDYLFNYTYRINSVTNSELLLSLYKKDCDACEKMRIFLDTHYNKEDRVEVMQRISLVVIRLKIKFLIEHLKRFEYKTVRSYLDNHPDFVKDINNINIDDLKKGDRKRLRIIKSQHTFNWFLGGIYYRYIRRDSGK